MAFKTYKDVNTGKIADYPEDFGDLFFDTLVEVDPDTLQCLDCASHKVEITEVPEVTEFDELAYLDTDYDKTKDKK